jgi:hypothetical protein
MVVVLSFGSVMGNLSCLVPFFPSILCCSFLALLTFILFSLKKYLTLKVVLASGSVTAMHYSLCLVVGEREG